MCLPERCMENEVVPQVTCVFLAVTLPSEGVWWAQVASVQPEAFHKVGLALSTSLCPVRPWRPGPGTSGQATHHRGTSHDTLLQKILLRADFLRMER